MGLNEKEGGRKCNLECRITYNGIIWDFYFSCFMRI